MKKPKKIWDYPVVMVSGATSGIGRALCTHLTKKNYRVAGIGRRRDILAEMTKELNTGEHEVFHPVWADVSNSDQAEVTFERVVNQWGRIDWLVLNAGFGVIGDVGSLKRADYQRQFDVNFYGALNLIIPGLYFLRKTQGRIGIVGSVNSYVSLPGNSAYSASKHMLLALSQSLREEERKNGISVTFIAPGFVQTGIRLINNFNLPAVESKVDPVPKWIQIPSRTVARKIERAMRKRRRQVIVGAHARLIIWLARLAPSLLEFIIRKRHIRSRPEPT